eukprot:5560355-Amphidinium_carterae.1
MCPIHIANAIHKNIVVACDDVLVFSCRQDEDDMNYLARGLKADKRAKACILPLSSSCMYSLCTANRSPTSQQELHGMSLCKFQE